MNTLEPLRVFLDLSRTLHFSRTAERCHVSPSAVSRTIAGLEREIGVTLFARDRRRVELTAEGERFRRWVGETLSSWEAFERTVRGERALEGALTIFCTVTASQSILPVVLGRFRDAHPGVHLTLETGYAADALDMLDRVDVTVAALPDRLPRGLVAATIAVTPLEFVAPTSPGAVSRAVERRRIDWSEVPLILPPFGTARDAVERWLRAKDVAPLVYSQVQGHEAILSLVALGCGVGVVPGLVLEKSPLREHVRTLEVRPALPEVRVGVCTTRRRMQSPLVSALWETITEYRRD